MLDEPMLQCPRLREFEDGRMTLTLKELAKEIWAHSWHEPILRTVADGAKRYRDVRGALVRLGEHAPGDGQISKELKSLHDLGLLERRQIAGTTYEGWALTPTGVDLLAFLDVIERSAGGHGLPPTRESRRDLVIATSGKGLDMEEIQARADHIDPTTPHPARRYNYWLGGKDNFASDRAAAKEVEDVFPHVRRAALENRMFLQRSVQFMASELGVDQFLDIGTGLPTADNTHEVAQAINPASRVVYVDNDPMVMAHARALLTSTPEGRSVYIEEDLRNPEKIVTNPSVTSLLDFNRPIGLVLVAVLHFIEGDTQPRDIVQRLLKALPSGSYLVASNNTADTVSLEVQAAYRQMVAEGRLDAHARTKEQFTRFFDGLDLVDPGVVLVSDWHSSLPADQRPRPDQVPVYGAVGRKP
jgi:DNA-binding HxlR family transcriptional regulator